MLLLHQIGSVKVGEVVRYTLTYIPSQDRILPPPKYLHVKIKNTSAIPLRAAYLHGPYTLYVACYPSTFDPNQKHEKERTEGIPEFEPQLKAGGHWSAKLTVPEEVRKDAEHAASQINEKGERKSFTWIVEVASQVLFSTTAAVHYELLIGRDDKSVELGFHGMIGSGQGLPGKLDDHQINKPRNTAQLKGVFSKAIRLKVDDTDTLWNKSPFLEWDDAREMDVPDKLKDKAKKEAERQKGKKQKKVHLVVLTHGLHSNVGADLLYLKESIDKAASQAREDAKRRKEELRAKKMMDKNQFVRTASKLKSKSTPELAIAPTKEPLESDEDEEEEEEEHLMVRGFNGNAVKTERGIQYLGKRLAKYVLSMTYPDQPYKPIKSSISQSITRSLTGQKPPITSTQKPIHKHSSIVKDEKYKTHDLPYRITSISFISHSLGGLVQTYAIAYIQKHSPGFFDIIKPINFVAMATPFLGLSNENPIYVKFALDFGLVGRTGQDLGLTWRAPTLAKSGWGAVIGGLANDDKKSQSQPNPGSKPLLRILPTGPAHTALKKFRNRTVYSNVVNDGIVPLRTSCLLFLDWRGLGRVEKARRENGLVGTMVGWGWAEMTGQNASAVKKNLFWNDLFSDSGDDTSNAGKSSPDPGSKVPQAEASQGFDDDQSTLPDDTQFIEHRQLSNDVPNAHTADQHTKHHSPNLWSGFLSIFKPQQPQKAHHNPPKSQKMFRRGQTMKQHPTSTDSESERTSSQGSSADSGKPGIVRGTSLYSTDTQNGGLQAPPKTTFFESAGDVLNPPLPPKEFILDPASRPRSIFHDRVYHPEDIPAPPPKRQRSIMRRLSSREDNINSPVDQHAHDHSSLHSESSEVGTLKIEEKIARAYHKDLSWRKVLVRLEPDAHNNMIVRRMFANAYGWPVVKHLCDTHFAYTSAAQTRDEDEVAEERAQPDTARVGAEGEQVSGQVDPPKEEKDEDAKSDKQNRPKSADDLVDSNEDLEELHKDLHRLHSKPQTRTTRTESEIRESRDEVADLVSKISVQGENSASFSTLSSGKTALSRLARQDSAKWSDRFFEGSEDDSDDDEYFEKLQRLRDQKEDEDGQQIPSARFTGKLTTSPKMTRSSKLAEAPQLSTDIPNVISDAGKEIVDEPAELSPSDPHTPDLGTHEPSLNLTSLGLRKSLEESMSPPLDFGRKGESNIAGNVALAQSKSTDK